MKNNLIIRVDDRLIHGQVVVGWAIPLCIEEIILISDRIDEDAWLKKTLLSAASALADDIDIEILTKKNFINVLKTKSPDKKIMVVIESIEDAVYLVKSGFSISMLVLGGIHAKSGREMFLPYLYLDSTEMRAILDLAKEGIKIVAKDLPGSKEVDVISMIMQKRVT
ncbi:PTS sugar transporter subunit IIB [bacterium]|nr:PTS sugar transporter subunit IIB [bacterium]